MPKKILCDKQKHCKKECPFPQTKIPPALYGAVFPISCFFCRTIGLFPTRHIQKRAERCIAASLRYDSVIRKLTIETTDGIFEGKIQLYVHDVDDVRSICDNLKLIQNIKQVTRIEG